MNRRRSQPCGFLIADAVAAVALAVLLAVAFTATCRQYAKARRVSDARRQLRLVAEAELLRLRADGLVGEAVAATRTIDDVALDIRTQPGEGAWSGMTRVTAVARRRVETTWVRVELTAYIPSPETGP